ncbi:MAG: HNH endonuclease [Acidimicrobiales bacterium]|jgi:hypothetical protein|nr:HNH endonuclease [Acidimicrobiales bacterium]
MTDGDERQLSRAERLERILERDGRSCVWCSRDVDTRLVRATTEHVVPRVKGGPSWIENEVAACSRCNSRRGHRSPADWLEACEARGWSPRRDVILARLTDLTQAIAERGGQRRARSYLAAQRRRLGAELGDGLNRGARAPGTRR